MTPRATRQVALFMVWPGVRVCYEPRRRLHLSSEQYAPQARLARALRVWRLARAGRFQEAWELTESFEVLRPAVRFGVLEGEWRPLQIFLRELGQAAAEVDIAAAEVPPQDNRADAETRRRLTEGARRRASLWAPAAKRRILSGARTEEGIVQGVEASFQDLRAYWVPSSISKPEAHRARHTGPGRSLRKSARRGPSLDPQSRAADRMAPAHTLPGPGAPVGGMVQQSPGGRSQERDATLRGDGLLPPYHRYAGGGRSSPAVDS